LADNFDFGWTRRLDSRDFYWDLRLDYRVFYRDEGLDYRVFYWDGGLVYKGFVTITRVNQTGVSRDLSSTKLDSWRINILLIHI